MLHLSRSRNAWGSPEFADTLKQEVAQLDARHLPLQEGLSQSSHVTDRPVQAMILSMDEDGGLIRVKIGVFYTGVIAGCSCTDDPTPISELNEYCVLQLGIDKSTAATTVTLLAE